MEKDTPAPKSLVDQIIGQTLSALEAYGEFDTEILEQLKRLSEVGGLKKHKQVSNVIKAPTEAQK